MDYREFFLKFGESFREKGQFFVKPGRINRFLLALKTLLNLNIPPPVGLEFYGIYSGSPLPKGFIHLSPREAEYLFTVARQAVLGIVEIGRMKGGSTFLLASANTEAPIYSIDIAPQDDHYLAQQLADHIDGKGKNVRLIVGDSQLTDYPDIESFDLLFIDGDHSYEGCKNDLENWFPKITPGGHIIFHDCYAEGVQRCIHEFISTQACRIIRSPYQSAFHHFTDHGSIAHIMKEI